MPPLPETVNDVLKATTSTLKISFPNTKITSPGQLVTKQDAQVAPTLYIMNPTPSRSYIALSLDPDAPFPSFPFLAPILHFIQTNLTAVGDPDDEGYVKLVPDVKEVVGWVPPAPPKISTPHRYVFMLWEQPEGISDANVRELFQWKEGVKIGLTKRIKWDEDDFERRVGVRKPVAGGWFVCG
jgi:phosphatidylethanolamine-binding protein (PEBP) family uncharacterized protein